MPKSRGKFIRASDVGEYVYCARAWKLKLDGHQPAKGRAARAAGEAWHRRHGRSVRQARRLRAFALLSLVVALVLAAVIAFRWLL